ncbi:MAG: hypothetical protein BGP13_18220 [Sphingobacteriales bacterium 40-81]|nr:MAG: hypothetical protein BGP13_18220 [Sphingobacteriales bacterium 40-81]
MQAIALIGAFLKLGSRNMRNFMEENVRWGSQTTVPVIRLSGLWPGRLRFTPESSVQFGLAALFCCPLPLSQSGILKTYQ